VALDVPNGAVSQTTTLGYTALGAPPAAYADQSRFAGVRFVMTGAQDGSVVDSFTFLKPVGFGIAYQEPAEGADEAAIRLFRYDAPTGAWQPAACNEAAIAAASVDADANVAYVDVCTLGEFALFETGVERAQGVFLPLIRR
jgi:hypothetical protein